MASNGNINNYGNLDDAFETYIDMDFLRNNTAQEDDETNKNGDMSTSDLFQYFFEGKLVKDESNEASSSMVYQPSLIPEDYNLISNPLVMNDQVTSVPTIDNINLLTQPQPITSNTSVETSVSILNAQLAELLSKLQAIKQEDVSDRKLSNMTTTITTTAPPNNEDDSINAGASHKTTSQSATNTTPNTPSKSASNDNQTQINDDDKLDIKLSSKERRQLRNKISARNFRVRRKEYIQSLASLKEQQQEEINILKQALLHLQEENTQLKQEVEDLRKSNQSNKSYITSPLSPPHNPTTLSSADFNNMNVTAPKFTNINNINNGNGNLQKSKSSPSITNAHQPASPTSRYLVIPNVNKDASPTSSSSSSNTTKQKIWQDSRVRVQTTFVPEFNFNKHLFEEKVGFSYSNLYEAIVTTPKQQMISALFRNPVALPELLPPLKNEKDDNDGIHVQQTINDEQQVMVEEEEELLNNNIMVESIKEASVLDWLYDSMVQQVIEQSQIEARIMELSSDWVGDDLDDNVLPLLF
ncbi:12508_t:CDS:2 [Entrophospora sp. SA101]|nr:11194_t:CDS:2 [Entrophospora sp. SA101]CAJ0626615.1 12508_t:CDS:2 [Entrophospora sp. SA101]CAJ0859799.1 4589_t:CDS:2 [Entrophospora sp. SA101]CAJ0861629.1 8262_t:CDS:2 [Entrophospora sp. SA101]